MENLSNKATYRSQLKKIRASVSQERRNSAKQALFQELSFKLLPYKNVLSFVSFQDEIDTSLLNDFLAKTERLLLPKMAHNLLKIYRVTCLDSQLLVNIWGISEPNPSLCEEVETVEIVLVPGLGFDPRGHRLGYGKGYYDRFLKNLPYTQTLGIGFKEQSILKLPTEDIDVALEKVSLF